MRSFKISTLLALASLLAMGVFAQSQPKRLAPRPSASAYSHKLSSSLRQMVYTHTDKRLAPQMAGKPSRVCALVKTADATAQPLCDNGCVPIAQIGDIFVADIPVSALPRLAADTRVNRIEAERGNALQLDSMALYTNAADIYTGTRLPQAYTGNGVVLGIMDVGFDLTHPTFLNADGSASRISRFWDQLSADTINSPMYVGAEYATPEAIRAYAHSRDGEELYHGTHTLGVAAGNGAGSRYVGMAPESELCLVSNAVSGDEPFIAEEDMYRYTTATDVLGFKYLFDYAESVGKPCVVSFSEGMHQSFSGDALLYYEALSQLVGPGKILVASVGNECLHNNYMAKPSGRHSSGTFLGAKDNATALYVKTDKPIDLRTIIYNVGNAKVDLRSNHTTLSDGRLVLSVGTADVCAAADSLLSDTIIIDGTEFVQQIQAYPSCFNPSDLVLEVLQTSSSGMDNKLVSMQIVGDEANAEAFLLSGGFGGSQIDPTLNDADISHSILSPGSAPDVICVGALGYRPTFVNYKGELQYTSWGEKGERGSYSSVGPTFDGRTKPDVMAPGSNIISAMSSYYMQAQPGRLGWLVSAFDHDGRTYGWSADAGTSMSTPAVAGIVALWLQANPMLSPDDVMGIIQRTSRPCGDYGSETPNYCGYGAIDAYAGLLDVLGMSAIEGLSTTNPQGVDISLTKANALHLKFAAATQSAVALCVYSTSGQQLLARRLAAGTNEYAVDLGMLKGGVYAVQVESGSVKGSVLIRIGH